MSRLSQLALAKRSVTLLLAAALFAGGILAWTNLKQELLPDVSFPYVTVIAAYPGAGAADVAEQVSMLGEKLAVMRPDGNDTFTSPGRPIASVSNVMIEYRPGPPPAKKAPAKKAPPKKP